MGEGGIKVVVGLEYSGSPMKALSKYSQRLPPRDALETGSGMTIKMESLFSGCLQSRWDVRYVCAQP